MRILNCIKTTADMDQVTEADWASAAGMDRCDFSYVPRITDPQCESGAELVLRMRERTVRCDGSSAHGAKAGLDCADTSGIAKSPESNAREMHFVLDALTIGDQKAEKPLRTLAALGYDGLYRIPAADACEFRPDQTAAQIAGFCRQAQKSYDLIVLGRESGDEGSRLVPYYLAEMLGVPILTDVIEMEVADADAPRLRVTRRQGPLIITETVQTPVIVTVGDVPGSYLRVPTLLQRRKSASNGVQMPAALAMDNEAASNATPAEHESGDPDAPIHAPRVQKLAVIDQSRQAEVFGGSAEDAATLVWQRYLKQG